uniref:Uncharacterized protein n=1 Tax=Caudovirales sp. ctqPn17 TaxID=2825772 RepID=A0A8S5QFQ7_9CAUD|nr:MAG TPA: hypothetical protein [Caudovirales sp. ctqPn17]
MIASSYLHAAKMLVNIQSTLNRNVTRSVLLQIGGYF